MASIPTTMKDYQQKVATVVLPDDHGPASLLSGPGWCRLTTMLPACSAPGPTGWSPPAMEVPL